MRAFPVHASILLCLLVASCTSEPLEFADWTIPVPEGTPIIEYAAVPMEQRTERIELVEDLVIGGGTDGSEHSFYRPRSVAVDDAGHIYVLDSGNHRVQVFDSDGKYSRTFGRKGQGPGELERPTTLTILSQRLFVSDRTLQRFAVWTLNGDLLGEVPFRRAGSLIDLSGINETLVGSTGTESNVYGGEFPWTAGTISAASGEYSPWLEFTVTLLPYVHRDRDGVPVFQPAGISVAYPKLAASSAGHLYLTRGDEYQIVALTATGRVKWALRVAMSAPRVTSEVIQGAIEKIREWIPDARPGEIPWPDRLAMIEELRVDGAGNLYVFPIAWPSPEGDEVPVDVYSPDGVRLFSGMISNRDWVTAQADYLYGFGESGTGDAVVVRYRLVEPF